MDWIFIDVVNKCNLRCRTCRRGLGFMKSNDEVMDLDLFQRIINKIINEYEDVKHIALYDWSEPFLNPHLNEYVSIVKRAGLTANISTNLSLSEIPHLEKTLKAGVDHMVVSMSGHTQEIHEINHVGSNIQTVFRHLEHLSALKMKGEISTKVVIRFLKFSYNEESAAELKRYASDLGLDFEMLQAHGAPEANRNFVRFKEPDEIVAERQFMPDTKPQKGICELILRDVPINCKGDAYLCCAMPEYDRYKIGSFLDLSRDDILALRFIHPQCRICCKFDRLDVPGSVKESIERALF